MHKTIVLDPTLVPAPAPPPTATRSRTKLTKLLSLTELYQELSELQTRNVSVRIHWDQHDLPIMVQVSRFYITLETAAAIQLSHDDTKQRYYLLKDIKKAMGYKRQPRIKLGNLGIE